MLTAMTFPILRDLGNAGSGMVLAVKERPKVGLAVSHLHMATPHQNGEWTYLVSKS